MKLWVFKSQRVKIVIQAKNKESLQNKINKEYPDGFKFINYRGMGETYYDLLTAEHFKEAESDFVIL